jgi:hypothetical protein
MPMVVVVVVVMIVIMPVAVRIVGVAPRDGHATAASSDQRLGPPGSDPMRSAREWNAANAVRPSL